MQSCSLNAKSLPRLYLPHSNVFSWSEKQEFQRQFVLEIQENSKAHLMQMIQKHLFAPLGGAAGWSDIFDSLISKKKLL
jgi:hypothetical protein